MISDAVDGEGLTFQLWDANTGVTLATLKRNALHYTYDPNVVFSPDGQLLAAVSGDNEIHVWEVPRIPLAAGAPPLHIAVPQLVLRVTNARPLETGNLGRPRALAFSADGRRLHSVAGSTITTWDATARDNAGPGPVRHSFDSAWHAGQIAVSQNGAKVALRNVEGNVSIWDVAANQNCHLPSEFQQRGQGIEFSPDGRRIAQFCSWRTAQGPFTSVMEIFNADTGQRVTTIPVADDAHRSRQLEVRPRLHPAGTQIASVVAPVQSGSPASTQLRAWDAMTGETLFSVDLGQRSARLLGYSPDGMSLVVAFDDKKQSSITFYAADSGKHVRTLPLPHAPLGINFKSQLVFAKTDADVVLYDLESGQERMRLHGHDGVDHFAISSDGRRLAVGGFQGLIRRDSVVSLWSLESGRRLLTIPRAGQIGGIAFSDNGRRLMAAYHDATGDNPIQIWDATPLPEEVAK